MAEPWIFLSCNITYVFLLRSTKEERFLISWATCDRVGVLCTQAKADPCFFVWSASRSSFQRHFEWRHNFVAQRMKNNISPLKCRTHFPNLRLLLVQWAIKTFIIINIRATMLRNKNYFPLLLHFFLSSETVILTIYWCMGNNQLVITFWALSIIAEICKT